MSDPRVEIVARGYDRIAETFAGWRERIEGDPRREWAEDLASRLAPGARVLELGCGAGSAETVLLAERFRLTGVDVSAEQIRRARETVPGAELVLGDMLEVELPAESFDAECSFYVFNHVPRERLGELLGRIHGWLRPGGLALNAFGASDLPGWQGEWLGAETFFAGFEPSENTRLVEAAGFTILRDEVVEFVEPEGSVSFHWILAQR
jgi:cyclopropane fatty-acyl-phospholipid synthase-like methyltransferase